MKILGCFKIVPDLDLVLEEDWKADERLNIDIGYAKLIWNCFDESAMEIMLKLSDASESFNIIHELHAFTIGKQKHESFLKILYALGFKRATRVDMEEELQFYPEVIANGIVSYVKNFNMQDVIITGTQSSIGSNRMTPYLVAEKLGWPCISQVIALDPVDECHLKVTSQGFGGLNIQIVKTPIVFAVGNALCAYLRVPTLKDKMRLGKQPIERLTMDELGMDIKAQKTKLVKLDTISNKRDTIIIEGNTPEEKAENLYENYLRDRLEE